MPLFNNRKRDSEQFERSTSVLPKKRLSMKRNSSTAVAHFTDDDESGMDTKVYVDKALNHILKELKQKNESSVAEKVKKEEEEEEEEDDAKEEDVDDSADFVLDLSSSVRRRSQEGAKPSELVNTKQSFYQLFKT